MADLRRAGTGRVLVSLCALAALAAGVWFFARMPGVATPLPDAPAQEGRLSGYHALSRELMPVPQLLSVCTRCHPHAPHRERVASRAFLNQHTQTIDCGVCHLRVGAPGYARFNEQGQLSDNPIHPIHLTRRGASGREAVTAPGDGARLASRPADCRDCHRRGGALLRTPGLFRDYRRLILEDLDVLRRTGAF